LNLEDANEVSNFIETNFVPYLLRNNTIQEGLFTGYYEMLLDGSLNLSSNYPFPLYKPPSKSEKPHLKLERQDIESGSLAGKKLELLYLKSDIDAFFLHIQGSAVIKLDTGSLIRVGYADKNGYPYFSIGRYLADHLKMDKKKITAEFIMDWLENNPTKKKIVMNQNPSYVFFRLIEGEGPIGAQGVPLTAERSIAIDNRYLPYGFFLWVNTEYPCIKEYCNKTFQKLMVTQDRGGAIKGPVRGDIFFGTGEDAKILAGSMNSKGKYYLLLPK
jgi:membrane-bound lytic murein transglycosylase A